MKEREIIETIARSLLRSPFQENRLFTSDAEIIELDGRRLAVTVDDYSAEDRLDARDARLLGWNLVTATVSDLLAVGAQPRFLLNSLVTAREIHAAYLQELAAGMQEALGACGASMVGGDVGTGAAWRFTGVALGTFRAGQVPLSRVLPCAAQAPLSRALTSAGARTGAAGASAHTGAVMVTGALGDANLAAGAGGPAPRFEMRLAESAALAAHAPVACIDTSDGLAAALETYAMLNPELRIDVDLAAILYAPGVIPAAATMGVPPEAFLMGSAGEYELLALVPDTVVGPGATPAAGLPSARLGAGWRRIGTFTSDAGPGVYLHATGGPVALPALPDPRAAASFEAYCAELIDLARHVFGASGRR